MDQSTIDYEQSLYNLQQQKEQLELMMRKMGEEWEASGPGINWLKAVEMPTLQSDELAETTMTTTTTTTTTTTRVTKPMTTIKKELASSSSSPTRASTVEDSAAYHLVSPLTPDDSTSFTTEGELLHILQQPQPSPEYLQSLLHVNETLLAQSLAATPLTDNMDCHHVPTAAASTAINVLSPSSEGSSDVYTPILTSSSSITMQTPPTTPEDEQVLDQ